VLEPLAIAEPAHLAHLHGNELNWQWHIEPSLDLCLFTFCDMHPFGSSPLTPGLYRPKALHRCPARSSVPAYQQSHAPSIGSHLNQSPSGVVDLSHAFGRTANKRNKYQLHQFMCLPFIFISLALLAYAVNHQCHTQPKTQNFQPQQ
jgi:hypothetical protein